MRSNCGFWLTVVFGTALGLAAQTGHPSPDPDSDQDGLSDRVETALLETFRPTFMVSAGDCSVRPASFMAHTPLPAVDSEDGTIYGQVFAAKVPAGAIEIHYYHLWRKDCGELGHKLDAEHASVLLLGGNMQSGEGWKAAYWYAASHEDTVCDASQVTRASTLHAVEHGPQIWISSGKHASFLSERLCHVGCGGDRCEKSQEVPVRPVVNLGERTAPMNGAVWLNSKEWPLTEKMSRSDFSQARLVRVNHLPGSDVAWANPQKRPAQAALLGANAGLGGAATGVVAAGTAVDKANHSTSHALQTSTRNTGHALSRAYHAVTHALDKDKQPGTPEATNAPDRHWAASMQRQ